MTESVYQRLDVPRVVNCVGYATRVGGSSPDEAVVRAMAEAQDSFVEIDDLQQAAWQTIARHTSAQGGIVTCGAGAALTLAAAACLAGSDPDRMDELPDASRCRRNRIIYPKLGPYDYDHAVRLSGATIDAVEYDAGDALVQIEHAVTPRTAAVGYVWQRVGQKPSVAAVARLAHQHDLPLILDAALSLPPTEHLRSFIEDGADLVALSGGKHLGGPQASGLLFGRAELVRSAWLQMVDLDVRPETWSLGHWVQANYVPRPPRHGVGRSMKVSKEAIVGVLTALERYGDRDHAGELAAWRRRVDQLARGLANTPELETASRFPAPNGQRFPVLRLRLQSAMTAMLLGLRRHRPKIILAEDERDASVAYIYPMCLRDDEVPVVIGAIRNVIGDVLAER
jgi:L-seryl-tRNA(Ser) seleniumtransferase